MAVSVEMGAGPSGTQRERERERDGEVAVVSLAAPLPEAMMRKLSAAVEEMVEDVVITDRDGAIEYVNPAFERLYGYAREEVVGKTPRILKSGHHPPQFYEGLWRAVLSGRRFRATFINRKKSGELVHAERVITPLRDAGGNVTHFVSVGRDVTERVRADEALREREERFRSVTQSALDAVISADNRGNICTWNKGAEAIFGYPEGEALGKPLTLLMPERYREPHHAGLGRFLSSGEPRIIGKIVELTGRRKDCSEFPLELSLSTWTTEKGPFFGAIIRDITQRKRAESLQVGQSRVLEMIAAGRPQEEVLTAIVRVVEECFPAVRCSIRLADKDGKYLGSGTAPSFPEEFKRTVDRIPIGPNAGACGTAAYRRETVIVEDVTTDPLFAGFRELVLENEVKACWSLPVLSAGSQVLGTFCMYYSESRRPKEVEKSLMDSVARVVVVAIEHYRSGQAKASLEAQLRQSQKLEAIGTLAGGVAHELNNPLQAIVNYSALLQQRIQDPGPGTTRMREEKDVNARMITDVHEAARRCAKIVRNLLAFARKEVQQKTTMDANEIIRRTSEFLAHTLSLNKVQLEVQLADNLPPVLGNPLALQQAFTNLILNARDAMPEGGTVTLATRQVNGHVEVSVKDRGTGVAPEVLSHLFEPFFTTKPPGQGTGLGLSVTYGIVQAHGGAIEVESQVGQGSTFRVRLPVHQPSRPRSPASASQEEPPHPLLAAEAAAPGVRS